MVSAASLKICPSSMMTFALPRLSSMMYAKFRRSSTSSRVVEGFVSLSKMFSVSSSFSSVFSVIIVTGLTFLLVLCVVSILFSFD